VADASTTGTSTVGTGARLTGATLAGLPAVVVAVVCLSTGSTLVRKIGAPGITIACLRSFIAAALWMTILACRRRRFTMVTLRRVGPAGVLFGVNIAMFFAGINHTTIANAEFISTLTSVIVLPAGAIIFHERIPWRALPWGGFAIVGIALVLFTAADSGRASWSGNLLVFGAVVLWATYLLVSKGVRRDVDVAEFMATSALVAGLVLLPIVVLQGRLDDVPASGWPWLIALTVMNGVIAHALFFQAQRHVAVGTISTMQVAQPALAAFWAFVVLGETIRGPQVIGMVIVLVALAAFSYAASRASQLARRTEMSIERQ
jgi:drug/metabolite transporter (DMT)-like permease